MPLVEKGTIKVVWIEKNTKRIYSKMFDDLAGAKHFAAKKKNCLVFKLVWHKRFREYCWTLLPYGEHKLYQSALKFYHMHKNRKKIIEKLFGL